MCNFIQNAMKKPLPGYCSAYFMEKVIMGVPHWPPTPYDSKHSDTTY